MNESFGWMSLISINRYSVEDYDVTEWLRNLVAHCRFNSSASLIDFIGIIEIKVSVIKCCLA